MASLLASLFGLTQSPMSVVTLLPLLGVALNYYRYTTYDPESHPIDVLEVRFS